MGEVYIAVNLPNNAAHYYEKASVIFRNFYDGVCNNNPQNAHIKFEYRNCLGNLGSIEIQRGNKIKAIAYYQEIISIIETGDNQYNNLAIISRLRNDTIKELENYNLSLDFSKANHNYVDVYNCTELHRGYLF
jgi:tetratricopeptide (TPR) repeat protein